GVNDPDGKPVVLKVAREKKDEYNELISREFQILAQFKHPNIVPVFDYDITDDGRAYFILEYITGKSINKCFKDFSEDFIAVIIQVINGLGAFHNKGFIHSDLKPEHILYNINKKKAVLIDFGFAQLRLAESGITGQDVKLAGTMGYIAPEVIKGIGIDQRSDLYSLGVIIYEILSGKKIKDTFEPIKGIPEQINNIIARLMSKEPAIRPTIPELYQIFSKYLGTIKVEMPEYQVKLPQTGFVEIPEIAERLSSAKAEAIIITGDTGAGKTRLLQEMKFRYLIKGYSVLFYLAREKTRFHESLQTFIHSKKLDISHKEDLGAGAQAGKFQIYEEITEDLIKYAKDRDVIIMVDDLNDLSDYELGLFRYIGYGLKDSNILLIGASQSSERINNLGFKTLSLRPFSEDETQELLEKTFFEISPAKKSTKSKSISDFTQWLHKESGGNPLFIVETLKTLYENKIIYYRANAWHIKIDLLKKIVIPKKLDDLLETRLKTLNDEELTILKILCLTNYPLEPSIISLILESDINIGIEHLKDLGLLKEEIINNRRVIIIANQILIYIIKKIINRKEKQLLSKALIKTIENTLSGDKDYVPILAQLCDEVKEINKAYNYFQSAAENAEAIYDYDAALEYYDKLAEYSKNINIKKYPELLAKIGDLNRILGNNKLAIDYYNKALKSKTKKILTKTYSGLGQIHTTMGKHNDAVEYFQKAMQIIEHKTTDYIKTANRLGYVLTSLSKFKDAETIFNKSLLLSKEIKDTKTEAKTLYYQASIEWFRTNFDKGIKKAQPLLQFCEANKLPEEYALCADLLSLFYQQKGNTERAQEYLDYAIDGFRQIKRTDGLCTAMNNKALLNFRKGAILNAKALYEEALIRGRQIGNRNVQYIALTSLANISDDLGRFEDAIVFHKKSIEINPDSVQSNYANYGIAMVFYKKGEIDKAKSIFEQKFKVKKEILYYHGLAMVNMVMGKIEQADEFLNKGLNLIKTENPDISTKIESFLKVTQFYYEKGDFNNSLNFSKKIMELTNPLSKDHNIASAFLKINNFNIKSINKIDIIQETKRLKEIGCIYDYAYVKKLQIESMINTDIKQDEIKNIIEELSAVQEVFESLGANLELNRAKKLQEKLYPIIVKDYSQRVISVQYLETFSNLAELISNNLGDEDFLQNTLDLIIQATNAERGALFIKTAKGMEFSAGRDIDRTTIKDASELSKTAIKEINKDRIVFSQDALSDPQFNIKKSVMLNQIRSLLCIPLSVSANVIGAIYLDSRLATGIFGSQDKNFLLTISRILASVIEKSIAFRAMTEENILLKTNIIKEIGSGYMLGKSKKMKGIYRLIDSVAKTNSPVLILGETGTGKGMIARLIHIKSKRKKQKFLTINCGTIPETLLESELFGHKKGSFTGAINDKKGLLEEAQGGTIFLDEITNTSPSFQAKLLEAIEDKIIRCVGETQTRKIDVRFLFATNKDLEIEVEENRFRKDLFYRINVFGIEIPPLRERVSDIPVLANFFSNKCAKEMNKDIKGFTPEAIQRLKEYFWQGNVRELQNVIERAVILAKGQLIATHDLGFEKIRDTKSISLKEIKKEAIIEALNVSNWNITKAAKYLDVTRRTIYKYIKTYNIQP
ncbi:MAG: tetratricopeptide repeat protein, partial [Candidatus Stahlbacteria bacterium]